MNKYEFKIQNSKFKIQNVNFFMVNNLESSFLFLLIFE